MKPRPERVEALEARVRLGEEPACHECSTVLRVDYIWTGEMRVYCINDDCALWRLMRLRA